jgi:hypothetical protein
LSASFPYKKSHEESSKLGHKPNVHKIMGKEGNAVGFVVVLLLDWVVRKEREGCQEEMEEGGLCYTKRDEQQKNPSPILRAH